MIVHKNAAKSLVKYINTFTIGGNIALAVKQLNCGLWLGVKKSPKTFRVIKEHRSLVLLKEVCLRDLNSMFILVKVVEMSSLSCG